MKILSPQVNRSRLSSILTQFEFPAGSPP